MLTQIRPLLQVTDLSVSVAFYGRVLGFQTGSTEGGFSIVRRDDCSIFLAQKTKPVDLTNKNARATNDEWCNYDLHIHCKPGTLDALWSEFRANGASMPACYEHGPILRSYGVRDFSVIDPDGYDLVFAEQLPDHECGPSNRLHLTVWR